MNAKLLLATAMITSSVPSLAQAESGPAMCYLSELEDSSEPSPLKHGIRLEVICAHASREVIGIDPESSDLVFLDGRDDLLKTGRRWMNQYKREHPDRLFFSSRPFNAINFRKPDGRVLPIDVHSSALPRRSTVQLKGSVVLYIAGAKTTTVKTTADAVRKEQSIHLPGESAAPVLPIEAGWSGHSPMFRLTGGGALISLVSGPEGVRSTNFSGTRLLVVGREVPGDAPIQLKVRISTRTTVPVNIKIQTEQTSE